MPDIGIQTRRRGRALPKSKAKSKERAALVARLRQRTGELDHVKARRRAAEREAARLLQRILELEDGVPEGPVFALAAPLAQDPDAQDPDARCSGQDDLSVDEVIAYVPSMSRSASTPPAPPTRSSASSAHAPATPRSARTGSIEIEYESTPPSSLSRATSSTIADEGLRRPASPRIMPREIEET